ncbi:MAG: N-6 DNA methylase [Planctomycetes bacterium]|nr:N-6 DNA methylase [Planctomycetota bacterium]
MARVPFTRVVRVVLALGRTLLAHPANGALRERLAAEPVPGDRFYPQLLALFFRRLFLARAGDVEPDALPDLEGCTVDLTGLDKVAAEPPEWGEIYAHLLELHPVVDVATRTFGLVSAAGHRRKTTGSYYTPPALVDCLLDSALEPVLDEALSHPDPETALLSLRVCDPACGSGHFLVAAARRVASRLAALPGMASGGHGYLEALREVVDRCLYGVDSDPLAVELCKVALWLECEDPGRSLASLGGHIHCGNSLIGAIPALASGRDPDVWTASILASGDLSQDEVDRLRARHRFFHWQREFPDVFGGGGGFDVVLGNPPWERLKLQQREWFAARCPAIAAAPDAATRRRLVESLKRERPALHAAFEEARRRADAEARFLLRSGRFPLSGRGDVNTYGPFVETARLLLKPNGRAGLVVPTGLATDDTMKDLFYDLLEVGALVSLYDFHNRGRLFPGVQGNVKFCLLTLSGRRCAEFTAAAQLTEPGQLAEPGRTYRLSAARVARLSPNTRHCPPFSSARDADLVARLHEHFPVLVRQGTCPSNPWGVRLGTMFHMTNDAGLFRSLESLQEDSWRLEGNVFRRGPERYLPLYEAKFVRPFNHRAATFADVDPTVRFRTHAAARAATAEQLADAKFVVLPRYWVPAKAVRARAGGATWFLGFRNAISAVADARSLVASIVPRAGVSNGLPLVSGVEARRACLLLALLNSFVLDYVLRQKASGGNLNFHVLNQLPVPPPETFDRGCPWSPVETLEDWFVQRVLALTWTSHDLNGFARQCGHRGRPFAWDETRRRQLRGEIDAACFRLYGLARSEVEYILNTFQIAERLETREHGRPVSREAILSCYDRLESCV